MSERDADIDVLVESGKPLGVFSEARAREFLGVTVARGEAMDVLARLAREARDERDKALKQKGYSDEAAHIYAVDLDKAWAALAELRAAALTYLSLNYDGITPDWMNAQRRLRVLTQSSSPPSLTLTAEEAWEQYLQADYEAHQGTYDAFIAGWSAEKR